MTNQEVISVIQVRVVGGSEQSSKNGGHETLNSSYVFKVLLIIRLYKALTKWLEEMRENGFEYSF